LDGEVGNGRKEAFASPFLIPTAQGRMPRRIALGHTLTCILRTDGKVQCFGYNGTGQAGNGTSEEILAPGPLVPLPPVTGLAVGAAHTCAVLEDTTVRCWGDGQRGQLGNGESQPSNLPVKVASLVGVSQLVASEGHTCALRGSEVLCWGDNDHGQLGDGAPLRRAAPTLVDGSAFRSRPQ
jgi:alpha-tubulin suppressor-like RCC1 family protein